MTYTARFCLIALTAATTSLHAAAPDPSLIGCWRAAKIVLHAPDGSKAEDTSGRCVLQFKDDQFESICRTQSGGKATTNYRYEIVRPHFYAATMTGSTFRTDMVGSTREYEYHVDGDRLSTKTAPQPTPPVPPALSALSASPSAPTASPRVETESTKTPCE